MTWKGWVAVLVALVLAFVAYEMWRSAQFNKKYAQLEADIKTETDKAETASEEVVELKEQVTQLQEDKAAMGEALASARRRARRQPPPMPNNVPELQVELTKCQADNATLETALSLEEMTTRALNSVVLKQDERDMYKDNVIDLQARQIKGLKRDAKKERRVRIVSNVAIGVGGFLAGWGGAELANR